MYDTRKLIGKGIKFPITPTESGGVATSEMVDRINQSLFLIFETPKGSRLFMPEFGSDIYKYRFDPFDNILLSRIKETVLKDIRDWEPRVESVTVKFLDNAEARDNQILYVSIDYKIINTTVRGNFVYPFRRDVYAMDINHE